MNINLKTQDFIRGKVLNVPNYENWIATHSSPEKEDGEYYDWSDKLKNNFEQIKSGMYLEGLPVTVMTMTNKGRLDFFYYHHTEDNMYPLGTVFTNCTIEQLEKLSVEQFEKLITEGMISLKKESKHK